MCLQMICNMTSSAPPPIEIRRRSRNARDTELSTAHAAPVLQAGVGDLAAQTPDFELGHRRQLGHVLAGHVPIGGAIDERAQAFDRGLEFSQSKMNHLVVEHRTTKGDSAARVVDGLVDDVGQRSDAPGRSGRALLLELHHLVAEAQAPLADPLALRHARFIEKYLRRDRGPHPELLDPLDVHAKHMPPALHQRHANQ